VSDCVATRTFAETTTVAFWAETGHGRDVGEGRTDVDIDVDALGDAVRDEEKEREGDGVPDRVPDLEALCDADWLRVDVILVDGEGDAVREGVRDGVAVTDGVRVAVRDGV
jgi:hypothetical protein